MDIGDIMGILILCMFFFMFVAILAPELIVITLAVIALGVSAVFDITKMIIDQILGRDK